MSSGIPFSEEVSNLLLQSARKLSRIKKPWLRIKSDLCEDILETKGKHASIGTISGQRFEANIEVEGGTTTVHFIVRTQDMKGRVKGRWSEFHWQEWTTQEDPKLKPTYH